MPHETEIVIRSFSQPVQLGSDPNHWSTLQCKAWLVPAVPFIAGVLIGWLF